MSDGQALSLNKRQRWIRVAVLLALGIPYVLPLFWMAMTSLKTDAQIFPSEGEDLSPLAPENLFPNPVEFSNYPEAMEAIPIALYTKNTVVLCVFNVFGAVLSSAIVAYGFARLSFRGKEVWFIIMLATMALPAQVSMIPTFMLFRWMGWYGTYLPLIVPSFFGVPFFIFLMRQFFRTLPEEMFEAARIDGASEWAIFWRLVLPLSKPVLATCGLFQLMHTWNDFFGPLLYINNPDKYTLAYGLQQFVSSYGGRWAELMAASTMFTVPIIVIFFLAQKTFIQGIATTGRKG